MLQSKRKPRIVDTSSNSLDKLIHLDGMQIKIWKLDGLLLIILGIVGILAIFNQSIGLQSPFGTYWRSTNTFYQIYGSANCIILIIMGINILREWFWQHYPTVILTYLFAFSYGFFSLIIGYFALNDSPLEIGISIIGTILIILTSLTILVSRKLSTIKVKIGKLSAVIMLILMMVFIVGLVIPFTYDEVARSFPDTTLRMLVRMEIGQPFWFNNLSDLEEINEIDTRGIRIKDIKGLEHCTNLIHLDCYSDDIKDITPLSKLRNLTTLNLFYNKIISDITPLANLTSLIELRLGSNNISDISPLSNLTNLQELYLSYNRIIDIGPLLENVGLNQGDIVSLRNNPLSQQSINVYIPELQKRGVEVEW